ncbi:hypothetical protein BCF55_0818 [Hydrogenivirga caldilitoris]|uniref:Uncharacterized protein n=1 Tax=Hydrogenivirga caldilitoris TaxID=246264 RepID=A0A497XTT8_9AQUI|nr:hypothetical protein [Hydrogenivirga caldilitoris]RLJ70542.1 hypothetical protein BCF55_0818 [Hydrogenivirga caldilitoris]
MLPNLDRQSFGLLIGEEKDFIVCFSEEGTEHPLFKEIFSRYASRIFILFCSPKTCPSVRRHLRIRRHHAILFFSGNRLIDTILELEDRKLVFRKVESFVKFSQGKDRFLLERKVFQRSYKKLRVLLETYYHEIGG